MELLAPAGSMESLKAAIYAGADAVYLGGQMFNARERAANFTFEELEEGVQLAHDYKVRIYITVNILTHDHELAQMAEYLVRLANCGVDAFIIQDLGVAKLARELTPQMELHASTQMTVHSAATLPLLIRHGFKRVVLAREVTVEEIAAMHEQYPEIGLEAFAHGALCYAYSGQCLLSSMIGGRSGNRGACAGPCRLPYTLMKSGEQLKTPPYLMSPRDLCLIDDLDPLQEAGVAAIKIEGRLKRPEYVYTVVSHYRKALDARFATKEDSRVVRKDLSQAFNRGFTKGLISGERNSNMMGIDQPDNRGIPVAKVISYDDKRSTVAIQTALPLLKGDILAWHTDGDSGTYKVEREATVGSILHWRSPSIIAKGTTVNRVVSIEQLRLAREGLRRAPAKFPLQITAHLAVGKPLELTAIFDEITVSVQGNYPLPEAERRPADQESVCRKLGKLGDTIWYLDDCQVMLDGNVMAPASELNECRRRLIEELMIQHRQQVVIESALEVPQFVTRKPKARAAVQTQLAVAVRNFQEAEAALTGGADLLYWGAQSWQNFDEEDARQLINLGSDRIIWRLPRISKDEDLAELEAVAKQLVELGFRQVMVDNLGQLELMKHCPELEVINGSGIPVFNTQTIDFLADEGLKRLTLSQELNHQQMKRISQTSKHPLELVVHGSQLTMIHELCILKGAGLCDGESYICKKDDWALVDRLSYRFPLAFDAKHRSYVYNSKELSLLDKLHALNKLQAEVWRLEIGGRELAYITAATTAYRRGIDALNEGVAFDSQPEAERLASYNPQGVTHGHFSRGV